MTNDGQLTTTEAAPTSYEDRLSSADAPSTTACEDLPAFSSSAGFIVKELVVDAYDVSGPSDGTAVAVFVGPGCSLKNGIEQINQRSNGDTVIPLSTGLVVPKKGMISFEVFHIGALVTAFGYTVPSKDAPHYSGTNHANIAR